MQRLQINNNNLLKSNDAVCYHGYYPSEASPWEKEVLLFARGASPFIVYDELLQLREPLKFDKLLGSNIKTTEMEGSSSESILQPWYTRGRVMRIPGQHFYWACTAVSNYVMRGTGIRHVYMQ
jgi:hypothetical protein